MSHAESAYTTSYDFSTALSVDQRDCVRLGLTGCWNDLQSYGSTPDVESYTGFYKDPSRRLSLQTEVSQGLFDGYLIPRGDITLREGNITHTVSWQEDFPRWGGKKEELNSGIVAVLSSIDPVRQSDLYTSRGTTITDDDIWGLLTNSTIPYQSYKHEMFYRTERSFFDDEETKLTIESATLDDNERTELTTTVAIGKKITKKDALSRKRPRREERIVVQRQDIMTRVGQRALTSTTVFSLNPRTGEIDARITTNSHPSAPLGVDPEAQTSQIIDACKVLSRDIPAKNDPLFISRRPLHDERPQN